MSDADSARTVLREHFSDTRQQHEADMMGLYVFLATEVMLFGGLFATIFVTRFLHPHEVVEAAKKLHLWIGAINTVVLLTSSLVVALAVHAARAGARRLTVGLLFAAAALGVAFLAIKGYEYSKEYTDGLLPGVSDPTKFSGPVEHLYMDLYFVATALHAVHVTIGVSALSIIATWLSRGRNKLPERAVSVETGGLYWHLVDVIWVFLYPVLYLAR